MCALFWVRTAPVEPVVPKCKFPQWDFRVVPPAIVTTAYLLACLPLPAWLPSLSGCLVLFLCLFTCLSACLPACFVCLFLCFSAFLLVCLPAFCAPCHSSGCIFHVHHSKARAPTNEICMSGPSWSIYRVGNLCCANVFLPASPGASRSSLLHSAPLHARRGRARAMPFFPIYENAKKF